MTNRIEIEKWLDVKTQTLEKKNNIDLIHIKNKNNANPVEGRIFWDVEVQLMENLSISSNKHFLVNKATQVCKEDILPTVKQENKKSVIR